MGFRAYIIETKHRAMSKYSYLQRKFLSKFSSLQDRTLFKSHNQGEKNKSDINDNNTPENLRQISMDPSPSEELKFLEGKDNKTLESQHVEGCEMPPKLPDGAQLTRIILIKGKIVEKEYLTTEGDQITLKL